MAADADDPLRLDRMICFQIYAASNVLTRLCRPLLAGLGLTYPQYLAMLVLWEAQPRPRSVGELGTRLHLDSGTLTPLLKRLEQAGLVIRARDPVDERRVLVALTTEGRSLREKALHVPDMVRNGVGLDLEQQEELRRSIATIVEAISPASKRD